MLPFLVETTDNLPADIKIQQFKIWYVQKFYLIPVKKIKIAHLKSWTSNLHAL